MADNIGYRIARLQCARQLRQARKLRIGESNLARAFHLDPDREIIAAGPALPARGASVPSALRARHELDESPVAANQEMRGNPELGQARVIRMSGRVEAVGEELDDAGAAERSRRQADVVDNEEVYRAAGGPLVAIR